MIGKTISHYKILEKLGEGGMGIVYKAEDIKLKRPVALKFLHESSIKDKSGKLIGAYDVPLQTEAQAAASVNHPNVCTIYEIDEADGQVFIAMEYVEGRTLKDIVGAHNHVPQSMDTIIDYATQIAAGLQAIHEKGMVHRDIKSENILITDKGRIKIMDFGLVKSVHVKDKLTDKSSGGTIAYLSPEQVRGETIDHRSDIWSFGVVLNEMLTGQLPFSGENAYAVVDSILNEEPVPHRNLLPEISMSPENMVFRLLEKNPDDRYQDMDELLRDLKLLKIAPEFEASENYFKHTPSFLSRKKIKTENKPLFCVGREQELSTLQKTLEKILTGRGQIIFVIGEAGCGKTTLINAFGQNIQKTTPDLIIAGGKCNAHTGFGDPYLPFRKIIKLLTGDVEAMWEAGAVTREHANYLWNMLPYTVKALIKEGPDLIDTFLSGDALVSRATTYSSGKESWLPQLKSKVKEKADSALSSNIQQTDLFEQYTNVLLILARHKPLLLKLDDLQWADAGSISLLFHLGRRLQGSRIFLLGAYRSTEVALGRGETRHPLELVINEFKQMYGDIELTFSEDTDRHFIDALIDTEPNNLGRSFRDTLFHQTEGLPLFTVELLRNLQEQKMIVRNREGRWIEGSDLDWNRLPARVDAVIGERIGRLPKKLQQILSFASILGETFIAEVIASLSDTSEREMIKLLSSDLDKRHHLVTALGIQRVNNRRLSLYRFRHVLFQKYLYSSLDKIERASLHEEAGAILEKIYENHIDEITGNLARHFREAGLFEKAVDYLVEAGHRALQLSANKEAIEHFNQALTLIQNLTESHERDQKELSVQIALAVPIIAIKGWAVADIEKIYMRARELIEKTGESRHRFTVLRGLWGFYATSGQLHKAHIMGKELVLTAKNLKDSSLLVPAYRSLGVALLYLGKFGPARVNLEKGIALSKPQQHQSLIFRFGHDPEAICRGFAGLNLWFLGYPEQAVHTSKEALASARKVSHPFTLAYTVFLSLHLHHCIRNIQKTEELCKLLIDLSSGKGLKIWTSQGHCYHGWCLIKQGQFDQGIGKIQEGLEVFRTFDQLTFLPHYLAMLAYGYLSIGKIQEGLVVTNDAFSVIKKTKEHIHEAEIFRLKGELLWKMNNAETEAEKCFSQALKIARRQKAKSWELRSTINLCRLWKNHGKTQEACNSLTQIMQWFTEGFNTPDLKEARALLDELSGT
ncbi:DUF2791 family P-loop domain-containing protein [bacterium]|nr:DUF2791 family P-loop domain-containing protein [bacterium]